MVPLLTVRVTFVQALALCGARGALAWTIVDHLLDTPAWQQRLREGKLGRGKDGSLPSAKLAVQVLEQRGSLDTRPSTRPGAADNFSSQRDARLLVLHAALDDTHQLLHRSDVTPGWQVCPQQLNGLFSLGVLSLNLTPW